MSSARLVNGQVHEFGAIPFETKSDGELLWVKSSDGWKSAAVVKSGTKTFVSYRGRQYVVEPIPKTGRAKGESSGSGEVRASTPGVVVKLLVEKGESVEKGQPLLLVEAMKTQTPARAQIAGLVLKLLVNVGQAVKANELLAVLESPTNI